MKIKIQKKLKTSKGRLVVPVFEDKINKLPVNYHKKIKEFIKNRAKDKEFLGKKGDLMAVYMEIKGLPEKISFLGCGKADKYSGKIAREIGGKLGKHLKSKKNEELSVLVTAEMLDNLGEFLEGILLSQYSFDSYKTKKKDDKSVELETLNLVIEEEDSDVNMIIQKANITVEAVNLVKELVNGPSNSVNGEKLVKVTKEIAKENKYRVKILGEKELTKMGWGGLLAVNQGAAKEPHCLVLGYAGGKKNDKPVVLVGKGVVFDSGGYNLKPTGHIETMHQDMAGCATVLGIFSVLKKLGIKRNVIGIAPIAENLISDKAYRPSDIIKMYSGKTVEITNTDAEGRLVLADAITYAIEFEPESIITIATLTGAVGVALGNRYAGLIGNDLKLRKELEKAGREVDDLGWPLPLPSDYKKKMDSKIADIRNADLGSSREAGSSKGAAFLERFVGKNKWCHIDIGGTAYTSDPKDYEGLGATGHSVRMLLNYLDK